MNRLGWWAVAAAVTGAVTASVLAAGADFALSGAGVTARVLAVLAGTALVVCGGVRTSSRGSYGREALALAGLCWLVAEWANPEAPGALVFTLGLAVGPVGFVVPLLAAVVPVPGPTRLRVSRAVGLAVAGVAAVAQGLLLAALSDPAATGCTGCPDDLLTLGAAGGAPALADAATGLLAILCALGVGAVVVLPARDPAVVRAVAASAVAAAGVTAWSTAVQGLGSTTTSDARTVASLALLALAGARLWQDARRRLALRAVTRGVLRTERSGTDTSAESILRSALGDPRIRVRYPVDGAWVDVLGTADVTGSEEALVLTDGGEVLAALSAADPRRLDGAALDDILAGLRLLLDVERLQARERVRARELGEARRRAVASADDARVRLERDLHDGAQQHLVALRYALGLARFRADREHLPSTAALLEESDLAVEQALTELRAIAHGMGSPTVASLGLVEAIRSAADRCGAAASLDGDVVSRLSPHVIRTSYAVVLEGLGAAARLGSRDVRVSLGRGGAGDAADADDADAAANVGIAAVGPRPTGVPSAALVERVSLVEGTIHLVAGPQETWALRAVLPCG